ncbi:MAG: sugar-binding domain-containing protein, partial [Planctomycetota bacterium]
MRRDRWVNLNGLWDYAVTPIDAEQPDNWDGEILIPFAIEAPLSGVGKRLTADQALWYRTELSTEQISALKLRDGEQVRLHFEAVDYQCEVWLDGTSLGKHTGGNLPFSFLIDCSKPGAKHELIVRVVDATDAIGKYQLRGKQRVKNRGIFYTPVSGIWQTVWMEP